MVQRVRKLAVKVLMILCVVCCVIGAAFAFTACSGSEKVVKSFTVNADGQIVITYSDDSTEILEGAMGPQGPQGDKGEQGEQGEPGEPGKPGEPGRGITKVEVVDGSLVITYTDDTTDSFPLAEEFEMSAVASVVLSEDQTKIIINYTDDREPTEITLPTVDPGELPEGASCDHEQMYTDGKYTITELAGVNGKMHTQTSKATYLVVYDCCGDGTGHSELLVNVDPIHNDKTLVEGVEVPATCEVGAYRADRCTVCGYEADREYINGEEGLGHIWSEAYDSDINDLPYCTYGGLVVHKCIRLYDEESGEALFDGDQPLVEEEGVSTEGVTDGYAEAIGTFAPIGHHASSYTIDPDTEASSVIPTYTTPGKAAGDCMFCGHDFTTDLSALYVNGALDTANYRLDEIVVSRTYCTDDGVEDYTVYLERGGNTFEVIPASGLDSEVTVPETVTIDEIVEVEATFTLEIKGGSHMINGVALDTLYYSVDHESGTDGYNQAYADANAIPWNTEGLVSTGVDANCYTQAIGRAEFVCQNANCGINNATLEKGDKWNPTVNDGKGGVLVPVSTYMEHDFEGNDPFLNPNGVADDGCISGEVQLCNNCGHNIAVGENKGHNYTFTVASATEGVDGTITVVLKGVCTVEGCTTTNANHSVSVTLTITESEGKYTVTDQAGIAVASKITEGPSCTEEGTTTYTLTGNVVVALTGSTENTGTYSLGTKGVSFDIAIAKTAHVFDIVNGKNVYIADLTEDVMTYDEVSTGYLQLDEVSAYFSDITNTDLKFYDITEYSDKISDYNDLDGGAIYAVCGPEGKASVGVGRYVCMDCEQPQSIPVYRSHIVDPVADDTTFVEGSEPTCTTGGVIQGTCTVCHQQNVTDETDALGHEYVYTLTEIDGNRYDLKTGAGTYQMTVSCSRIADSEHCGFENIVGNVVVTASDRVTCEDEDGTLSTYTISGVANATNDAALAEFLTKELGAAPWTVEVDEEPFHILNDGESLIRAGGTVYFTDASELQTLGITATVTACATLTEGTFPCKNASCENGTITINVYRDHKWDAGTETLPTCTTDGSIVTKCTQPDCATQTTLGPDDEGYEYLAALGHDLMVVIAETTLPEIGVPGRLVLTCQRDGCDTDVAEGAQAFKMEFSLPAIQESWFNGINEANAVIDTEGAYTSFVQKSVLTCGTSARYDVTFTIAEDEDNFILEEFPYPFEFEREPEADMHTFVGNGYFLIQHTVDAVTVTSVGKFCSTCEHFIVEDGHVYVGVGVRFDEELDKCYDAAGKELAAWTSSDEPVDPPHTHTWVNGYCAGCNTYCDHATKDGNTCTVCGATITSTTLNVTAENPATAWTWVGGDSAAVTYGQIVSYSGTLTSTMATNGATFAFELTDLYTGGVDNYGWYYGNGATVFTSVKNATQDIPATRDGWTLAITDAQGGTVEFDWATYCEIAKDSTWTVTLDWTDESEIVMTIELTANSGTYAGYTYTNVCNLAFAAGQSLESFTWHISTASGNTTSIAVNTYEVIAFPQA